MIPITTFSVCLYLNLPWIVTGEREKTTQNRVRLQLAEGGEEVELDILYIVLYFKPS